MTSDDALRYAAHEAAWCRSKEEAEALCLLFPPMLAALKLEPMNGYEAEQFRAEFRAWLQEVADRARADQERTRI